MANTLPSSARRLPPLRTIDVLSRNPLVGIQASPLDRQF
jgi:hypothetical protein